MTTLKNPPNFVSNPTGQWQTKCSNIGQVFEHLFMNPIGADICFVPLLNASDPPKKFPAHKLVLFGRSTVLAAQFHYDELNLENDENAGNDGAPVPKKAKKGIEEVELPDIEPQAFEQFLRFCYTDKAELTGENVTSVLYTANRYNLQTLIKQSIQFLSENTKVENVFEMLEFSKKFDYEGIKEVEKRALEIIRKKTEEVMKTEAFLIISQETLEIVVKQANLAISGIDLFNELIHWAENRQKFPGNEEKTLRELLGPALFYIQFWKMDIKDFGKFIVPKNVLTDAEAFYVFKKVSADDIGTFFSDPECPFQQREFVLADTLTLIIKNLQQINATNYHEVDLKGDSVCINGFTFFLSAFVRKNPKLGLVFVIFCRADGTESWSCDVNAELTLVSKKPDKRVLPQNLRYRFRAERNYCFFPDYIPFERLLDPIKGCDEDDTVTFNAYVNFAKNEEEK